MLPDEFGINQSSNAERIADESQTSPPSRFVHRNLLYFNAIITIGANPSPPISVGSRPAALTFHLPSKPQAPGFLFLSRNNFRRSKFLRTETQETPLVRYEQMKLEPLRYVAGCIKRPTGYASDGHGGDTQCLVLYCS